MKMEAQAQARPVAGFRFAGASAGFKTQPDTPDVGLIVADRPVAAAAVFTTNRVKAAPVIIAQERVRRGRLQAVVANSGCANCFTGRAGLKLAQDSCSFVANEIGCAPTLVAPCSTGVIGRLYDFDKFRDGARRAVSSLSSDGLDAFARAIMTTDTRPKVASISLRLGGADATIAGATKGAGMIAPKMATLLGFVMTDAAVPPAALKRALVRAMPSSFNAITIDGDMSTNDTVILLASGAAQNRALKARDSAAFERAVSLVCAMLARALVRDGEGATRLVTVEVRGARGAREADTIARQIANSPLVKTAFFGCDPNVGRIIGAAGAAGVAIDPDRLELFVDGVKIAARGAILTEALTDAQAAMRNREFTVRLDLKAGKAGATILTSDLSIDYVRINAEYTT
jgi:glutamate N-acetyltransferase / amino-acid N-acetyltransferase